MCSEGWSQLCTGMERLTHGYGRHGGHGDYMIARCRYMPDAARRVELRSRCFPRLPVLARRFTD